MNSIINLTPQQLRQAAKIQDKIAALEKELGKLLNAPVSTQNTPASKPGMSAAARARIAAAQKARWAKQRGSKAPAAKAKTDRKVTSAGRKRLSELAKARWAKVKAAGRKTL